MMHCIWFLFLLMLILNLKNSILAKQKIRIGFASSFYFKCPILKQVGVIIYFQKYFFDFVCI